jgi:hypothetical protein
MIIEAARVRKGGDSLEGFIGQVLELAAEDDKATRWLRALAERGESSGSKTSSRTQRKKKATKA